MNINQVSGTLLYIAAALFYLAAIIHFASGNRSSGVLWLALGSAFLCLGSVQASKRKKDGEE